MRISQVLEVICDRGEGVDGRWSIGSGYLVNDGVVLTAAHVVADAAAVSVRFSGGVEYEAAVLLCTPPEVDLALVAVKAGPTASQPTVFGWVSRERPGQVGRGRAVGFPRFKEISRAGRRLRDSVQVDGYMPTAEGLVSGYLTFRVDARPAALNGARTESAWAGISGAAVFAGDILVGVVSEHHLAEGDASLTVAPFDRLDLADEPVRRRFWELLHVDEPSRLTRLEPDPGGPQRGPSARIMALPPPLSDFTGRDQVVADVIGRVSRVGRRDRVVVIWGQPGVGKSQLAVEVAHRLLDRHPDGACHVDLQGYSANRLSAEQVAARLLEALAPESELPTEPSARFAACRDVLRRGRYVVVLDNASSTAQIRELLPGPCDTAVLVTSRSSLTTVDAALVELDVLDTASAVALIRRMVDGDGESRCGDDAEVGGLIRLCGRLPLALRIAGALLRARPAWTVGHLVNRLADENRRLHLLKRDDLAVRPVFESGYAALDGTTRRLFALLGSVGAIRIAPWMAAALLGSEVDEAEEYLEQLVEAQLLRPSETDSSGTLRYRFHDLVRLYAREKMRGDLEPQAVTAAEERLLSGHLALVLQYTRDHPVTVNFEFAKSTPLLWAPPPDDVPTPADPMEWLMEERGDLVSSVEQAHAQRHWCYVWALADILHTVFILSHHGPESRRAKDLALAAALAAGDEEAELEVRYTYLSNLLSENRHDEGLAALSELRERRLRRGEARKVAHLDLMTGVIERDGGRQFAAERSLSRSLDEFRVLHVPGDPTVSALIASAQHNLAIVLREQGRLSEADALLSAALETFDVLDDRIAAGRAQHTRGVLHCYIGRYDEAQQMFQRSHELCRGVGDRRWTVIALLGQARLADRLQDWPRASLLLDECETMFTALYDKPGIAQVQRSRAVLLRRTGRYQEAEVMFAAAHASLKAVNDRRSHARLHYSQALLELARSRRDAALDFVRQAEQLFTVKDDAVWRCRVLVARARLTGRPEEGLTEKVDGFADLAGAGFQPLWVTEARRRLSERS